jgi:hypothetical protein
MLGLRPWVASKLISVGRYVNSFGWNSSLREASYVFKFESCAQFQT